MFPITDMITYAAVKREYAIGQSFTHQSAGIEPVALWKSVSKVSVGECVHTVLPSLNALKTNGYLAGDISVAH